MTRTNVPMVALLIAAIAGPACAPGPGDDNGGHGGTAAGGGAGSGGGGTTGAAGTGVSGGGAAAGNSATAGAAGTSSATGTAGGGGNAGGGGGGGGVGGTTGAAGAGGAGTSGTAGSTGAAGRGGSTGGAAGRGGSGGSAGRGGGGGGGSAGSIGGAGVTGSAGRGGSTATAGTTGTAGAGGGAGTAKFHVFLLLGQSNMAGYPKAQDADKVKNERIRVLGFDNCAATGRQQDKWDVAVPPLHECWNGALGPGDYFSKTLISKIPAGDTLGLVPCAVSGEKIETFLKVGGTHYSSIVQRGKLAQQAGGTIEGILFHQGESNNGDTTWPGKVNTLVTDLRADLGIGNVPFLAGELAYDGACAIHNMQVAKLPALVSNSYIVSASGLALDPADTTYRVHFGHDAQVTFGMRYATKMIEALHW